MKMIPKTHDIKFSPSSSYLSIFLCILGISLLSLNIGYSQSTEIYVARFTGEVILKKLRDTTFYHHTYYDGDLTSTGQFKLEWEIDEPIYIVSKETGIDSNNRKESDFYE